MGFPTKNDHFGVFWGYHHLRKPPHGVRDIEIILVKPEWFGLLGVIRMVSSDTKKTSWLILSIPTFQKIIILRIHTYLKLTKIIVSWGFILQPKSSYLLNPTPPSSWVFSKTSNQHPPTSHNQHPQLHSPISTHSFGTETIGTPNKQPPKLSYALLTIGFPY